MNQSIRRHPRPSLRRSKSAAVMIASVFQFTCGYGFLCRGRTSMRASLCQHRAPSVATVTTIAGAKFEGLPHCRSLSSRTMSNSPSSSKKTIDDEFYSMSLSIPTMEVMEEVGALIAIISQPTDVLFLDGDLGAGKTTFSRGFIKCKLGITDDDDEGKDGDDKTGDSSLRITSPTYLLSNTYEYIEEDDQTNEAKGDQVSTREIHHMDLYRLSGKSPKDFEPLGLDHVFSNCISLIEWPSRLKGFPELLPPEETVLKIDLRIPDPISDERVMTVISSTKSYWTTRLQYLIGEGMVDDLFISAEDDE